MWISFRSIVWFFALIGAYNVYQIGLIHLEYNQPIDTIFVRDDSISKSVEEVFCNANDLSGRQLVDMAIMSAATYDKEDPPLEKSLSPGWEKLKFTEEDRSIWFPRETISGLHLEFWSNKSKKISVISFRGTEGLLGWHANLHWLMRYLPVNTQYEKVRNSSYKLVEWLNKKNQAEFTIYATGHSLGGGLAQHALYSHKSIKNAVVFNSSPVTGWNDVEEGRRTDSVKRNTVIRIHEHREIMEFFRLFMKIGYVLNPNANENPKFVEYRVNFNKLESTFKQHAMIDLAKTLVDHVDKHCPI